MHETSNKTTLIIQKILNMRRSIHAFLRSAFLLLLPISSTQAVAEVVAQLYGGDGFTQKHNAKVNLPEAGISGTHEGLTFDTAATLGGRVAYWIDSFSYLGLGIDASHFFGPDQRSQIALTNLCVTGVGCSLSPESIKKFNNNVTVVGLDFMLRYPVFKSAQFASGQLQPYLSVGPAWFITTLKDTDNFIPADQSSRYTSLGVKAGAGLLLFFTKHVGVFLEYRDTNFKTKDTYNNATMVHGRTLGRTLGTATFNIQAIVGGLALSF